MKSVSRMNVQIDTRPTGRRSSKELCGVKSPKTFLRSPSTASTLTGHALWRGLSWVRIEDLITPARDYEWTSWSRPVDKQCAGQCSSLIPLEVLCGICQIKNGPSNLCLALSSAKVLRPRREFNPVKRKCAGTCSLSPLLSSVEGIE